MTPLQFAQKYELTVAVPGSGGSRELSGVYCCDLLSLVMGRAQEDEALLTVMANVNTIAVAVLSDVSCVILCEGIHFDEETLKKAEDQEVCVLYSDDSTFYTALKLAKELQITV